MGVYLLSELPMKQSKELVFQSRPGLSVVGEEVKLYELQYETKRSVLDGRGWGHLVLMLITSCKVAK